MKLKTANMKFKEAECTEDADDNLAHKKRSDITTICW
jgi:hypothetical protein